MLFTNIAIICSYPMAIIRVMACFHLVYKVTHSQRMVLGRAKDQRLFTLIDFIHEKLNTVRLTLLDLYYLVKIRLRVEFPDLNFSLYQHVVRRINILIKGSGDLLHFEGGKKSIINTIP